MVDKYLVTYRIEGWNGKRLSALMNIKELAELIGCAEHNQTTAHNAFVIDDCGIPQRVKIVHIPQTFTVALLALDTFKVIAAAEYPDR